MSKTQSQVTTLDDDKGPGVAAPVAAAPIKTSSGAELELSGKNRVLTIHQSEGDGGSDAVAISINGYAYQIPRGKPVEVPDEVVQVLQNATQTLYSHGEKGVITERQVPRFAFSVN